jgi:hypothetical protein
MITDQKLRCLLWVLVILASIAASALIIFGEYIFRG